MRLLSITSYLSLIVLTSGASLQALVWNGGTGDWNTGANWTPAGPPTSGDDANITPTGSVVNVNSTAVADDIELGGGGSDVVTLNVNASLTYYDIFSSEDWGVDGDTIAVNINSGGTIDGGGGSAAQASRIDGYNTTTVNSGGALTNIYRLRLGTDIVLNGGSFRLSGTQTNGNGSFGLNAGTSISGSSGTLVFPVTSAGSYTNMATSTGATFDVANITIALEIADTYTPMIGDSFDLTSNTNGTQTLGDGTNIASTSADGNWAFTWDTSSWNPAVGNTGVITITSVTAIPEPSTYAAFAGLAVLAFSLVRRRR